ncbi:hypothetical protein MTO96_005166 [Rhipicephalus appendiculatus]
MTILAIACTANAGNLPAPPALRYEVPASWQGYAPSQYAVPAAPVYGPAPASGAPAYGPAPAPATPSYAPAPAPVAASPPQPAPYRAPAAPARAPAPRTTTSGWLRRTVAAGHHELVLDQDGARSTRGADSRCAGGRCSGTGSRRPSTTFCCTSAGILRRSCCCAQGVCQSWSSRSSGGVRTSGITQQGGSELRPWFPTERTPPSATPLLETMEDMSDRYPLMRHFSMDCLSLGASRSPTACNTRQRQAHHIANVAPSHCKCNTT